MNKIASILDEIKEVYCSTATNLASLSTRLEEEIRILEISEGSQVPAQLLSLCKLAIADIKKNNIRCDELHRLQNKFPPLRYSAPRGKTVPYLKRVK